MINDKRTAMGEAWMVWAVFFGWLLLAGASCMGADGAGNRQIAPTAGEVDIMQRQMRGTTIMAMQKRIVVGISGASGAMYAKRTVALLTAAGCEVHLVVSPLGQRLLHDELGMASVDLQALAGRADHRIVLHPYRDVGASIASGSFEHDGMVIVPCSNNTLAAVATGVSNNLLHRAANVTLKERRRLVLCHREMPLSLIEIRNMAQVTEAGGVICPANPGFYMLPKRVDDLVDQVAGRLCDLLGVAHDLQTRWADSPANPNHSPQRSELNKPPQNEKGSS